MKFQKNKPIYLQICDYIMEQIISKEWSAGDRVKSVRELGADMEVNPNTVMRSYTKLQDLGIIANKRGIGYFVDAKAEHLILENKKKEFLEQRLPELFKEMALLSIELDELNEHYQLHKTGAK